MEALSASFRKAEEIGAVTGFRLPNNGPSLSHLLFADDALVVGEWSEVSICNVVRILRCFHICSGLRINLSKSSIIGVGIGDADLASSAMAFGCRVEKLPFKYLGLPVGANMNRISNWRTVIELFESRLSLWKASLLSIGGRLTLIKSVLQSLPLYFFSLFRAPVGVIDRLEGIMRKFLWGGSGSERKMSWVSWECVTSPVKSGGLGVRKLGHVNSSLLMKWAWRLKTDGESLWAKVVTSIHSHARSWDFLPARVSFGGVWVGIVKTVKKPFLGTDRFRHFMKGVVGNGSSLLFWSDPWLNKDPLRFCFPNLFALESDKNCSVRDRIVCPRSNPSASWQWKYPLVSSAELAEWAALSYSLRDVTLSDRNDRWSWVPEDSGEFSVKSAYVLMGSKEVDASRFIWEWCKWTPLKCNIFAWRAVMDRLPTKLELRKRSIQVGDVMCPLCGSGEESADHLFTACSFATAIWSKISSWCKVPFIMAFSFKDVVVAHRFSGLKGRLSLAYQGIVLISCWLIWQVRNDCVFNGKVPKVEEVFCSIRSLGFLWFSNRSKCIDMSWIEWCKFV
ncbi:putative RNA-directed DNA polymerase [Helianthus annuus]|nr:putative RNA-directed DNA polymerase [Helianthus annuus]